MSTTFSAHFDGQVLIPDQPVSLPVGQKLKLRVEPISEDTGQFADLAQFAADLPDSPGDLASQHDHYLYGSPQR
jgi:AF2212-like